MCGWPKLSSKWTVLKENLTKGQEAESIWTPGVPLLKISRYHVTWEILPTVLYLGYLLFKRDLTYFFLSGPFTHPQFALAKTVWWVRGRNPSIPMECHARPSSSTRYHVSKHLRNEDNSIPSFQQRTQFILQRQLGMNETFSQESGSGFLKLGELRQATSPRMALRFYIQTWVYQCFLTLAAHQTHTYLCVPAKLLQSCLTLCDYMDHSPSGSFIPGILQARILEWVAISFSKYA